MVQRFREAIEHDASAVRIRAYHGRVPCRRRIVTRNRVIPHLLLRGHTDMKGLADDVGTDTQQIRRKPTVPARRRQAALDSQSDPPVRQSEGLSILSTSLDLR